jgi:hypothetical protein
MKTIRTISGFITILLTILFYSCSTPVTLTSMKKQTDKSQVSKVVIMAMFKKLEYIQPFEQSVAAYFASRGLKSAESLTILDPSVKYTPEEIRAKVDSIGGDGVLVVQYAGTDKSATYVPTTYYGGYRGYWGGGYYGGYYGGTMYTTGYWSTSSVVNLTAYLFTSTAKDGPVWTGDIKVTDPKYVDQAAVQIAQSIYADWQRNNLLKPASGK